MEQKEKKYSFLGLEVGRIGWWGALVAYLSIPTCILGYALWFGVRHKLKLDSSPEAWAHFGDFLAGTAGPVIGFASIMLLLATLGLQRTELQEQRKQLAQSTKEVNDQNKILLRQSFEQTFFGWLRDYKNQISYLAFSSDVNDISLEQHEPPKTNLFGIKALVDMAKFLMSSPVYEFNFCPSREGVSTVTTLQQAWKAIHKPRGDTVRAAIRSLYGIIKWVDSQNASALSDADKLHYVSIIRAQLTDSELVLLFVNGLTQRGEKFVHYINKYALFDNLVIEEYQPIQAVQCSAGVSPYKDSAFNTDIARKTLNLSHGL